MSFFAVLPLTASHCYVLGASLVPRLLPVQKNGEEPGYEATWYHIKGSCCYVMHFIYKLAAGYNYIIRTLQTFGYMVALL